MRAVLILALALLAAWPAHAQDAVGTNRASVAQLLFLKGREAFDRADFSAAERFFHQSYELDAAVGTLLNLALSEDKVGKLSEAWQHAREVVDALPPDDTRVPIARTLLESLEGRLPRLQLMLDGRAPSDAVVELDGILLEGVMLGTEIPVNPGSHDVVVRAPGRRVRHAVIHLDEGQRLARVVAPGAVVPSETPPAEAPPPDTSPSASKVAGISLLASGGAGLAAALVLGGLVLDRKNIVEDHCIPGCDDDAFAAADEGSRFSAAATGTFIGGLALSAAGAIVLIVENARIGIRPQPGGTSATLHVQF